MGEYLINNIFARMDNLKIKDFKKIEWSNDWIGYSIIRASLWEIYRNNKIIF